jgi:hypothetical protein
MIRLLLVALAGWAAWRYRSHLKRYADQLPQVQSKAAEALNKAAGTIAEGLNNARDVAGAPSGPGRKGQASP